MGIGDRLQHAWNVFRGTDTSQTYNTYDYGYSSGYKPDRVRLNITNERSIIASIYNRIGIDVASVSIQHVRLDNDGRYLETLKTDLNHCLTMRANIDQTGRALIQDITMSLCDEGAVAIVPVEATIDPSVSGAYDIQNIRVGKIIQWYPKHVRVKLYNERSGRQEERTLSKETVAIIENPLYSVMNEPNSTLKRLIRKLNLLDSIDEQSGSGKLDIIIQLPYVIKSEARKAQAEDRRKAIEMQLSGSRYGIAYTDGTEKITQLNRPAENNLMKQIEYLTNMLYSQLGLTESIINGTADEAEMNNYFNRTIEPFLAAITDALRTTFLTKTAITQKQSINYFRDPFKLITLTSLSEIADTFTRNEIVSSNEIRGIIGFKPSNSPGADDLRNKNLNPVDVEKNQNGSKKKGEDE